MVTCLLSLLHLLPHPHLPVLQTLTSPCSVALTHCGSSGYWYSAKCVVVPQALLWQAAAARRSTSRPRPWAAVWQRVAEVHRERHGGGNEQARTHPACV